MAAGKNRFRTFMRFITVISLGSLLLAYLCPYVHPKTLWILPFFGLAYPIIITTVLLLLLYWIYQRSKWALYLICGILLGGTLHFRTLAITFSRPEPSETDNVWKVLSYNVRLFDVYNESDSLRNRNRDSILAYVKRMDPDVVCFQEFFHQDAPTDFPTRTLLTKKMGYVNYNERYSHKLRGRQNFGICMLTKYPIVSEGVVPFANLKSDNYCIFADIVKGGDTIRFYTIHLQSIKLQTEDYELFGEQSPQASSQPSTIRLLLRKLKIAYPARADQARRVVKHMESSPYPVVICGDFNDTPLSYVYNQFNKSLIDSWRETSNGLGVTYAGKVPAGRIDYIFHSDNLRAANFRIQKEEYSDHYAVSTEIWKHKADE